MSYSIIGIIAILVHLIINRDIVALPQKTY